jgi:hypothetical protein
MGVPLPIIIIICLIMGMFAIAGGILYSKNREKFRTETSTIDPLPPEQKQERR